MFGACWELCRSVLREIAGSVLTVNGFVKVQYKHVRTR